MFTQKRLSGFEEGLKNAIVVDDVQENINDEFVEEDDSPKTVQMFDIVEQKQTKKGVIDSIFNDIPKIELPQIKTIANAKSRRALLIALVLLFLITTFALISIKGTNEQVSDNKELAAFEEFDDEYDMDDYNSVGDSDGLADLIPKGSNIDNFTIKQPISTKPAYSPTIANISWEAPESLVSKANYTKFLQLIGKNVKLNLQNDLLLVSDIPVNKIVKVDINIAANGNVNSIKMTSSSGSPAIDSSVKKIVNETLTYMKPPSHGIISKSVDITLILELN